jgi:hypothetical protein
LKLRVAVGLAAAVSLVVAVPAAAPSRDKADPVVSFTFSGDWDIVNTAGAPPSQQATRERSLSASWRLVMGPNVANNEYVRLSDLRKLVADQSGKGEETFTLSYGFKWKAAESTYKVDDTRPGQSCEKAGVRRFRGIVVGDRVIGRTIYAFTDVGELFTPPANAGQCSLAPATGAYPKGTWSWEPPLSFTPRTDPVSFNRRQEYAWFPIDVARLAASGSVVIPVSFTYKYEPKNADSIVDKWSGEVAIRLQ